MSMKYGYQELAHMIDHALLHPTLTEEEALAGCEMAHRYGVATVCVKPYFVATAARALANSPVRVSCVVGFPAGNSSIEVKRYEAEVACRDGAREIDMVINIAKALEGDWGYLEREIGGVTEAVHALGVKIKVIIETDYVTEGAAKIRLCEIVGKVGADWIKTSTGFGFTKQNGGYNYTGATESDLMLMRKHCPASVQVKASGGVRNLDGLIRVRELGCTRLGTSGTVAMLDEYRRREKAGEGDRNDAALGGGGY